MVKEVSVEPTLLIGGSGFLGSEVRSLLADRALTATFAQVEREQSDAGAAPSWLRYRFPVDDPAALARLAPARVVITARLASDPALTVEDFGNAFGFLLRSLGPAHISYMSSDAVFAGDRGSYSEEDTPAPRTPYGQKQWRAEQLLQDLAESWSVVRSSFIVGSPAGRVDARTARVRDRLMAGKRVLAQTRVYKSPVPVEEVARLVADVSLNPRRGVFHAAGERMSVEAFFRARMVALGLEHKLHLIEPGDSEVSDTSLVSVRA